MSGQIYERNRVHGDSFRQGIYCTNQEQVDFLGASKVAAEDIVIAAKYIPIHGNTEIKLWTYAKTANLAAGVSNLTLKWYRFLPVRDGTSSTEGEYYQVGSDETLSSPAATAGTAGSLDITSIADTATHFTIEGTIAVSGTCLAAAQVGKSAVV